MLDLGTTEFVLAIPSLPETELKRQSTSLFDDWEGYVDTALSLPDYSLFLQVEEGSVKGATRIGAAIGALYTLASASTAASSLAFERLVTKLQLLASS